MVRFRPGKPYINIPESLYRGKCRFLAVWLFLVYAINILFYKVCELFKFQGLKYIFIFSDFSVQNVEIEHRIREENLERNLDIKVGNIVPHYIITSLLSPVYGYCI